MNLPLILSGAALGLASGGHCIAMCGAGSAYMTGSRDLSSPRGAATRLGSFHAGRMVAYASVGALLGGAAAAFHVLTEWVGVLRPLWTMANTAMFLLGAALLITARQPQLLARIGDAAGQWLRNATRATSTHAVVFHQRTAARASAGAATVPSSGDARGGRRGLAVGLGWAFIPCGPLYSAWTLALFAGDPLSGALTAAAFAGVSGMQLALAQWWFARFGGESRTARSTKGGRWDKAGLRVAGAALCVSAGYSIAMLLTGSHDNGLFCL